MYGTSIKPQRALGTGWIDHKMNAIIDKYGLCVTFTKYYSGFAYENWQGNSKRKIK